MGTVSIVIPAFNEEDLIRRSLQATVGQTVPAREILVVDNGQVEACFADGGVAAATGPVYYWDLPFRRLLLGVDAMVRRLMLTAVPNEYRFLFGSNMALRASAWERIRGETCPDEHDRMHEDIDLALHLAGLGLRIAYSPSMVTGISSRRLDDSPRDFASYVARFGRTYAAHGIHSKRLRAPTVFFLGIYVPARLVRRAYGRWSRRHQGNT